MTVFFAIVLSYLFSTVWEASIHWKILHASPQTRKYWKRIGGPFNLLRKAHFSHNVIHHQQTYRKNYFIQFENPADKEKLDKLLNSPLGHRIIFNQYGLTISAILEIIVFILFPIITSTLIFCWLCPLYIWIGISLAITPMLLSKYIHPLLHVAPDRISARGPLACRLYHTRLFRYIQRHHFLHHEHGLYNFNLFPGGDYLLGVWKHYHGAERDFTGAFVQRFSSQVEEESP